MQKTDIITKLMGLDMKGIYFMLDWNLRGKVGLSRIIKKRYKEE